MKAQLKDEVDIGNPGYAGKTVSAAQQEDIEA